ncbi:MAG: mechanosensitive ion channel family protein [Deltaproteobacteria bacterium]|nr:mechanosensitive ion channel family protein [Deltaproteobacteria bacterium]
MIWRRNAARSGNKFLLSLLGVILLAGFLGLAWEESQATESTGGTSPAPNVQPAMVKILMLTTQDVEKEIASLEEQINKNKKDLDSAQKVTEELNTSISAMKAALALDKIPLRQAETLLKRFSAQEEKINSSLQKLEEQIATLEKKQADDAASLADLKAQIDRLKDSDLPAEQQKSIRAIYQRYLRLATAQGKLVNQLIQIQRAQAQELHQQQKLVHDLTGSFQTHITETWKEQLFTRRSIYDFWYDIVKLAKESVSLPARLKDWTQQQIESEALRQKVKDQMAPLVGLLVSLAFVLYGTRRLKKLVDLFIKQWEARAFSFAQKSFLAIVQLISRHAISLVLVLWLALGLWILDLLKITAIKMVLSGLVAWVVIRLLTNLNQVLFGPRDPDRRIIPVVDETARFYGRYGSLYLIYVVAGQWVLVVLELLKYPMGTLDFSEFIYEISILLGLAGLLKKPHLGNLLDGMGVSECFWWQDIIKALRLLVLFGLMVVILGDLLGFHNLATYLSQATVNTTGILFLFLVLAQLSDDFATFFIHPKEGLLVQKFPSWTASIANIYQQWRKLVPAAIVILAIPFILDIWGMWSTISAKLLKILTYGPHLGPVKLTPLAIVLAIVVLYLANRLSHLLQFLMEKRLYSRKGWDEGVQATISKTTHYALMTLGTIVALGFMGFNLTNIALIAGALGVGIGFGLQNIVHNFISGLILLLERPIKVGDMLIIDGQWGMVKEVRVRSTVFQTFDRYVLIIPNSELISNKVLNWTFYGKGINRLSLKVGVAYGSDVHRVTKIIDRVCRDNPNVLHAPPPTIYFSAFGDSSLDFNIWVYLRTPDVRITVTHELNCAIFDAFREHGIEIPFPQRDLHIKQMPESNHILLMRRPESTGQEELGKRSRFESDY